jgi:hypothetical protein
LPATASTAVMQAMADPMARSGPHSSGAPVRIDEQKPETSAR